MGFRSSRRYHPNQKNEIYNLGVVPDLQISKKVVFLMIHMFFFFEICFCICFLKILGDQNSMQIWSGEVGGWHLAKKSLKKQ